MRLCLLATLCCVSLCMCSVWSANFTSPYPEPGSFFGQTVAASGEWAIVQAQKEPRSSDDSTAVGAAFMYHQDSLGQWVYDSRLPVPDAETKHIGYNMAIDGEWCAVAGHNTKDLCSYVYLFHLENGVWTLMDTLPSPGPQDSQGQAVAMGGGVLVIGYPDSHEYEGEAVVYRLFHGQYYLEATLVGADYMFAADNGDSVAISADGSRIAMGSLNAGQVNVFDYDHLTAEWTLTQTVAATCWDGVSLSLSGDGSTLAVGCPTYSAVEDTAGQVEVFTEGQDGLTLSQSLDGGSVWYATFGYSLDMSSDGDTLVVGATLDDSVYVYTLAGGLYILADWETTTDDSMLGHTVALGGAGEDVALVGMANTSNARGKVGVLDLTLL
ncbi:hypothetical protein KIPB_003427 [Kipferlia bialata]|uniref:Uncharacterized protein n=1 Tax=Kipferlia bialata TaxID=797122 RepID=A0A9K3CS58_9EUKA|nr:hypothetical protein KIPB_003427 [Kipferlia bialata]|eukprot:g3427.t1